MANGTASSWRTVSSGQAQRERSVGGQGGVAERAGDVREAQAAAAVHARERGAGEYQRRACDRDRELVDAAIVDAQRPWQLRWAAAARRVAGSSTIARIGGSRPFKREGAREQGGRVPVELEHVDVELVACGSQAYGFEPQAAEQ
jgi:hypothetical protein